MKVSKWVDMGQEVEVEVDAIDIHAALCEAFENGNGDPLDEDSPSARDILKTLNSIAGFFNGFRDENIAKLTAAQRNTVAEFLAKAASRFVADMEVKQ